METIIEKKRINYLDAIKALGIVLVIRGHVQLFGFGVETYDTLTSIMFYSFNMPIFFFVSGYLAYTGGGSSYVNVLMNLYRKLLLLVIPAVIFSVAFYLYEHKNVNEFCEEGFGKYWFTITLWQCFFVYGVIKLLATYSTKNVFQLVMLVGLSIFCLVSLSLFKTYGHPILDLNHLMKYFPFFAVGVISHIYNDYYEKLVRNRLFISIFTLLFFATLFFLGYSQLPSLAVSLLRDVILRYLGTFIIISWFVCHSEMFNKCTRFNRILLDVGKNSLGIYLLQYFFIPDLTFLSVDWHKVDSLTQNIVAFSYSIVIVIVCYIFISLLSNSYILQKYVLGKNKLK